VWRSADGEAGHNGATLLHLFPSLAASRGASSIFRSSLPPLLSLSLSLVVADAG
jgi:hypothetical protein